MDSFVSKSGWTYLIKDMPWNYHSVSSSFLSKLSLLLLSDFRAFFLFTSFFLSLYSQSPMGSSFQTVRAEVGRHSLWPGQSQIKCKRRALLSRLLETPHSVLWRWAISSSRERGGEDTCLNHGQSCHYRSWLMSGILSTRLLIGWNGRRKCFLSTPMDIVLDWGRN